MVKITVFTLVVVLLVVVSPVSAANTAPRIVGSPAFTAIVQSAMQELRDHDKADYDYVTDGYVYHIIEWNGGYSFADLTPGYHDIYIADVQINCARNNVFWIAGIIVHERTHFWDFTHGIDVYDEKPPLIRQVAALKTMGAPGDMINFVASFIH